MQHQTVRSGERPTDHLHQRIEVHSARPADEENQFESRRCRHHFLRYASENQVPGEEVQSDEDKVEQGSQLFAEIT